MESDVNELNVVDGSFSYKGKIFDFVDYRSFCLSLCASLSDEEFSMVVNNVASFVQEKNISMRTKSGWNEFFGRET
jgi:hypothetical protein